MPATLLARWALYYADHKVLSIAITYLHLAGVLIGGGAAVALLAVLGWFGWKRRRAQ